MWVISVSDQLVRCSYVRESSSLMGVGQSELFVDETNLSLVSGQTQETLAAKRRQRPRITGEENSSNVLLT